MADIDAKFENSASPKSPIGVTTGPIRGSRKVHVASPTGSGVRVAMREIDLDPHSGEPSVRVYDTSGPYTDPNARIDIGQRVGIIGRNGTGKSSLFALLRSELHADAGDVIIPAHWVLAHVAQEMPETDESALDYVLAGDAELVELNAELTRAEQADDGTQIAHCHAELARIDAYSAPARAAQLLNGLGFAQNLQRFSNKQSFANCFCDINNVEFI